MAMIEINRNPSWKELRVFGGVLLPLFLLLVGGFIGTKTSRWEWLFYIGLPGIPIAAVGWIRPRLLRRLYVGWMFAVWPIGIVVSHVLLGIIYYLVVTPIGLVLRLMGRDAMCRRFDPKARTYWVRREAVTDMKRYYKQF